MKKLNKFWAILLAFAMVITSLGTDFASATVYAEDGTVSVDKADEDDKSDLFEDLSDDDADDDDDEDDADDEDFDEDDDDAESEDDEFAEEEDAEENEPDVYEFEDVDPEIFRDPTLMVKWLRKHGSGD